MAGAGGRTGESLLLAFRRSIYFALFAAQVFTFRAESMIRRPDAGNDEVKAFGPVGTSTAEMPDVATRVCSVFHGGEPSFPLDCSSINKA